MIKHCLKYCFSYFYFKSVAAAWTLGWKGGPRCNMRRSMNQTIFSMRKGKTKKMKRPHKQASKQKRGGTNARANKHAKTQIHNKNCNSPGLGPGRVRSLTGLFWYCSGIGIWLGEGLPSPLTPLPWASGSENCLPDPPSKVAVTLPLDLKKTP